MPSAASKTFLFRQTSWKASVRLINFISSILPPMISEVDWQHNRSGMFGIGTQFSQVHQFSSDCSIIRSSSPPSFSRSRKYAVSLSSISCSGYSGSNAKALLPLLSRKSFSLSHHHAVLCSPNSSSRKVKADDVKGWHMIPSDEKLRAKWIAASKREPPYPKKGQRFSVLWNSLCR